ncbi:MAG: ELWxxDGT repeat protein [Planctomycetota bacterium]
MGRNDRDRFWSRSASAMAMALAAASLALGQARLVLDINGAARPGSSPSSSRPAHFTRWNGHVYFAATRADIGREVFRSAGPGTTALFADVAPGPGGSDPHGFTALGSRLVFAAMGGLWQTDGLSTARLADLGGSPFEPVELGGRLFFHGADAARGGELWVSDGTAAGTGIVADLAPGVLGSRPSDLCVLEGALYFAADDGRRGRELWRSDGTAAGTTMVAELVPGPVGGAPRDLVAFGRTLLFSAYDWIHGQELWRSDGTAAGTAPLDLEAGAVGTSPGSLTVTPIGVFFAAATPSAGRELWRTDGTAAGTSVVIDLAAGAENSTPDDLVVFAGGLAFTATAPMTGRELWWTDGSRAGTRVVADVVPGGGSSAPGDLAVLGGSLFFAASGATGRELWRTDGTVPGTRLVREIWSGTQSAAPHELYADPASGRLWLAAASEGVGVEPWLSDGTAGGTVIVDDVDPIRSRTRSSSPEHIVDLGGIALFSATSTPAGRELWRTDGTAAGTSLLADIDPGSAESRPADLTRVGDRVFFSAEDSVHGRELWVTDGTTAGTRLVKDIFRGRGSSSPSRFCSVGRVLFFTVPVSRYSLELWTSDGTESGTTRVSDSLSIPYFNDPYYYSLWSEPELLDFNGVLLVTASSTPTGCELFRSDGTAAGTFPVLDIEPGQTSSGPLHLVVAGDQAFFSASTRANGRELWVTDGTAAGTREVLDLAPGRTGSYPDGSNPIGIAAVGNRVFFAADDSRTVDRLWTSDGTAAGTWPLHRFYWLASSPWWPSSATVLEDQVLYAAGTPYAGQNWVLLRTDGTGAGTYQVREFSPPYPNFVHSLTTAGSRFAFFTAADHRGLELWWTAGYPGGAGLAADIHRGGASSDPQGMTLSNGRLLFSADDGEHGRELWAFEFGANAQAVGPGCGSGRPELRATDPVLGRGMIVSGSGAPPGASGVLMLGDPTPARLQSGVPCPLYFDTVTLSVLASVAPQSGAFSLGWLIPDDPALQGQRVTLQAAFAPTLAPTGVDMTGGVYLTFGR